jgi:hypothetical protein
MGRPQLSFPAVADEYRDLGSAYFVGRMPSGQNAEIGQDIYGFGADARRMAMARVQSTHTAQRLYDRTPRFRVTPTQMMSSQPFGINHTRDTFPSRMMGAGSIGALTTPEGQQYRRKILDARAEQLRAMESDPPVEPSAPAMKELTEKEAMKDQYALEFKAIENEFNAGVVERSQAAELSKWVIKFFGLLPYYDRNDLDELLNYQRRIDAMLGTARQVDGEDAMVEANEREMMKRDAVNEFIRRAFTTWDAVVSKYLGQERDIELASATLLRGQRQLTTVRSGDQFGQEAIINMPLKQRITAVKSILRNLGLARQVDIPPPTEEDEAADGVEDEEEAADEFADDEDGGEAVAEGADEEAAEDDERPRTQAEITAAVNELVAQGVPQATAIRQIAQAWEDVTGYRPTELSTYKSIRQTLVQRIKSAVADGRLAGRGRMRGGRMPMRSAMRGGAMLLRGRSSQAVTYPIHQAKEQFRQLVKARK